MEGLLVSLDQRVDRIDQRIDVLGQSVQGLERSVALIDQKGTGIDEKFGILDRRIHHFEGRFDRMFLWAIGIQMTTLLAMVAGLFGIVGRLI
jgi:hypothetical protein